jgi:molybdopterin synthase sulfur carrier subunit
MKIRVKFFASQREAVGKAEEELQISGNARVKDIMDRLVSMHPKLGGSMRRNSIYSLNQNIVGEDAVLRDGDVLAIFPPVGGG